MKENTMGLFNKKLFNFVKDAGEKLLDTITGKEAEAAEKVKDRVQKQNLDLQDLDVKIEGDKVILNGKAQSAEALEKAILAAGNINGVGSVETNVEVEGSDIQDPTFYEVQSGDTLSGIAKKFYGDANQYPKIFEANKPMLSDPDKIYPGQNLRIPHDAKKAA